MGSSGRTSKQTQRVSKRDADRALREALVPALRAHGFEGSLPHFHASHPDGEAWVVSIQHDKYGGGFRAELAWVPPQRIFAQFNPPQPKLPSTLKAWSVSPALRKIVPRVSARAGGFIRYDTDLASATRRIVAALKREVPTWFLANRAIASQLRPGVDTSTLHRLQAEAPWVRLWVDFKRRGA